MKPPPSADVSSYIVREDVPGFPKEATNTCTMSRFRLAEGNWTGQEMERAFHSLLTDSITTDSTASTTGPMGGCQHGIRSGIWSKFAQQTAAAFAHKVVAKVNWHKIKIDHVRLKQGRPLTKTTLFLKVSSVANDEIAISIINQRR